MFTVTITHLTGTTEIFIRVYKCIPDKVRATQNAIKRGIPVRSKVISVKSLWTNIAE
jgi:hypothetical protein